MTQRDDADTQEFAAQLQPLVDDDAFLTELSRGTDPSAGTDPLAALFLELRDEVEAPMPPAPVVEGAEEEPEVISLAAVRRRRRVNPWMSGLIGAAAATVLLAGSGAVVYNAGPGSPLYGLHQSVFSSTRNASEVELAASLEEADDKVASGDIEGARAVLLDARKKLKDPAPEVLARLEAAERRVKQHKDSQVTVTVTVEREASGAPTSEATATEPIPGSEVPTSASTPVAPAPIPEPNGSVTEVPSSSVPTEAAPLPSDAGDTQGPSKDVPVDPADDTTSVSVEPTKDHASNVARAHNG